MNFNLKDVVCIDLTKYTDEQLLAIENQEGYPNLSFYKREGCLKVFIETNVNDGMRMTSLIACMINHNKWANYKGFAPSETYSGNISKYQRKYMMDLDPINFEFEVLTESIDLDDILDKISKHGIKYITQNEKDYLDKMSKEM